MEEGGFLVVGDSSMSFQCRNGVILLCPNVVYFFFECCNPTILRLCSMGPGFCGFFVL